MILNNIDFIINKTIIKNTIATFECSFVVLYKEADKNLKDVIVKIWVQNKLNKDIQYLKTFILNPTETNTTEGIKIEKTTTVNIDLNLENNNSELIQERWFRECYLIITDDNDNVLFKSVPYKLFSEKQYYPSICIQNYGLVTEEQEGTTNRKIKFELELKSNTPSNYRYKKDAYFITATLYYTDKDGNRIKQEEKEIYKNNYTIDIGDGFDFDKTYNYATVEFKVKALNGDTITSVSKILYLRNTYAHVYIKTPYGIRRIKSIGFMDSKKKLLLYIQRISMENWTGFY